MNPSPSSSSSSSSSAAPASTPQRLPDAPTAAAADAPSADELAALRRDANAFAREFLGASHKAKKRSFEAGSAPPAQLQRYHRLRRAYNAFHAANNGARRAERRRRKAAHGRFARGFLGPDNAVKRARLEAADIANANADADANAGVEGGGSGSVTPAELQAYREQRRAYEDFAARSDRILRGRRKGRAKAAESPAAQRDAGAAERARPT